MKIKFDYDKTLGSMTVELVAESNLDEDCVEIMWRDRFAVVEKSVGPDKTSIKFASRK